MKKWLNKARFALLYSLPVVVFFTNFPLIHLGDNSSMNFEISLPMIWLAVFDILSLAELKSIAKLFKKHTKLLISALFLILWLVLSCFWSANPLRGFLTAGLVLAIFYAILSVFADLPNEKSLKQIIKIFLGTSFAVSVFCIFQGFLDVFGLQNNLLCVGCHYQTLGFPHSNGFAIEPQFMGNLLIAPCIVSLEILYKKIKSEKGKGFPLTFTLFTFIQIIALFICFSRGAIFSFILAVMLISGYSLYKKQFLRLATYLPITILAFAGGLLLQGLWAEISPTSEGFSEGISYSISQLSLGKIELNRNSAQPAQPETQVEKNEAQFNGYIEESTDIRLKLSEDALKTWKKDPATMLFGVGLGGAGHAMSEYLGANEKEIVQNEFVSLLLEIGIVGWISILLFVFFAFKSYNKQTSIIFLAILIAYLFSMGFYSGLTNVWHIYLFTPVLYLFFRD